MNKNNYTAIAAAISLSLMAVSCQSTGQSSLNASAEKTVVTQVVKKDIVDLQYDQFTLDNGLRVIVHEDRKAPIVSVGVWYHVGSKNEPAGKTGFAFV